MMYDSFKWNKIEEPFIFEDGMPSNIIVILTLL